MWIQRPSLEILNHFSQKSLIHHLGIEFIEVGDQFLRAKMPVDQRTMQPYRLLHGGASCVLIETTANAAANFCVDPEHKVCVGLEINVNHIKAVHSGVVFSIAEPLHIGRMTQVWNVRIYNEHEKLTAVGRLTVAVIDKQKHEKPAE